MSEFNLLHLSDLHISIKPNVISWADVMSDIQYFREALDCDLSLFQSTYSDDRLQMLARYIVETPEFSSAKLLVISGDLATRGDHVDLTLASDFIHGKPTSPSTFHSPSGFPTLYNKEFSFLIVPGNHDRYDNKRGRPGGIEFDSVFKKQQHHINEEYWPDGKRITVKNIDNGIDKLAVIGVDFTLYKRSEAKWGGFFASMGQGRVSNNDGILATLEAITKHFKKNKIPVIWVTHFPPQFPGGERLLKLLEGGRLLNSAKDCGVKYILSGHQHKSKRYLSSNGVTDVIVAGSASSTGCLNSFNELKFEVNGDVISNCDVTIHEFKLLSGFLPNKKGSGAY